jgi:hypothetical protein
LFFLVSLCKIVFQKINERSLDTRKRQTLSFEGTTHIKKEIMLTGNIR